MLLAKSLQLINYFLRLHTFVFRVGLLCTRLALSGTRFENLATLLRTLIRFCHHLPLWDVRIPRACLFSRLVFAWMFFCQAPFFGRGVLTGRPLRNVLRCTSGECHGCIVRASNRHTCSY